MRSTGRRFAAPVNLIVGRPKTLVWSHTAARADFLPQLARSTPQRHFSPAPGISWPPYPQALGCRRPCFGRPSRSVRQWGRVPRSVPGLGHPVRFSQDGARGTAAFGPLVSDRRQCGNSPAVGYINRPTIRSRGCRFAAPLNSGIRPLGRGLTGEKATDIRGPRRRRLVRLHAVAGFGA